MQQEVTLRISTFLIHLTPKPPIVNGKGLLAEFLRHYSIWGWFQVKVLLDNCIILRGWRERLKAIETKGPNSTYVNVWPSLSYLYFQDIYGSVIALKISSNYTATQKSSGSSVLEAFCIHWWFFVGNSVVYARSLSLVTILRVIPMATKRKYSIWTPFKTIRDIEFPCDASNEVFMIDNGKECCLVYYKESWNSSSIPFILSVFYLDAELSVRCW